MKKEELSKQAQNSLKLYAGGNPETIERLLEMQGESVVNELKKFFHASSLNDLSIRLSIRAY